MNFAKTTHSASSGKPGGFFDNMNQNRIAVFIDGSNLYFKLKDLKIPNTTGFDYLGLCNLLARKRNLISHSYYVGVVRATDDKKEQERRMAQRKLFNTLMIQRFTIRRGYLMNNNGRYHEKGVDVQIAVDLLVGAYENKYDVAIIISSDTDLIPVIKKIRELGKEVEYIGFSHAPSFALQKNATISRLLIREDIEAFIKHASV